MDVPQAERFHVELDPQEVLRGFARHRRRFAASVSQLGDDALAAASRCSEWSVADVLRHGADVDGWMEAFWNGKQPPFTSFDPNVTPHEWVIAGRAMSDAAARDRYVESSERIAADVDASGEERWGAPGISPLGVVPWWLSVTHIFFDSWLHERDVFLPMGIEPKLEDDELRTVLTYTVLMAGSFQPSPFDAVVRGARITVDEDKVRAVPETPVLDAVTAKVVDALTGRDDLGAALTDCGDETKRALSSLGRFLSPV